MSRFLDALYSGRVLLMDGAMGTELQRAGLRADECGELWNLTHPDKILAIHQAYLDAGSDCLLTNTFQANKLALERNQLANRQDEINSAGYALARSAAGTNRYVLGDIGPVTDLNKDLPGEFCRPQAWGHMVAELIQTDGLLLETFSDPLALDAAKQCRLASTPFEGLVLLSLTYQRNAAGMLCTRSGHPPEWYAARARDNYIDALGMNCGKDIGMDELIEIVRRYRQATDLPLFARPNAGTPARADDRWVYPHTPEDLAARLPELLEAGVSMVGGCCGTTPDHIAAFRPVIDKWNQEREEVRAGGKS